MRAPWRGGYTAVNPQTQDKIWSPLKAAEKKGEAGTHTRRTPPAGGLSFPVVKWGETREETPFRVIKTRKRGEKRGLWTSLQWGYP